MSLKLKHGEKLENGLHRLIEEECRSALDYAIEYKEEKPHSVVHELRKSFKKVRAILRLFRDNVDYYKKYNNFFRDLGRRISDIRDSTSVLEALAVIKDQHGDLLSKNAFVNVRNALEERRNEQLEILLSNNQPFTSIEHEVEMEMDSIKNLVFNVHEFSDVHTGISRVYARGRRAFRSAESNSQPDVFHEWRKRVKYLRYQLDVINIIWPQYLDELENELHKVSDYLGSDRDLFMLQHCLQSDLLNQIDSDEVYLLASLINKQREQLQKHAIGLGFRIYSLKAKYFMNQLGASWDALQWERGRDLMPAAELEH